MKVKRNLENYILHLDNFISKETCEKTLFEMKNINYRQHTFYSSKGESHTRSGSKELEISYDNVSTKKEIMDRLWYGLKKYMQYLDFHWFDSWRGYSEIRFNRYSETQKMAFHMDHIHSLFDDNRGIPTLSCVGLLNDDYEGGEFIMFDNHEIKFKQGDLIIFPSNFLYPHKVEPVTRGTRYSFVSWVW